MNNADRERQLDEFVHRNVYQCASTLITELVRLDGVIDGEYSEDLLAILSRDDYREPCEDAGWRLAPDGDGFIARHRTHDPIDLAADDEAEAWRELAEIECIDPYTAEAYEHWIVSSALADWLEDEGEMISRDVYGLTIWGRTCTGQAISMDGVIGRIFDKLEGFRDKPTYCCPECGSTHTQYQAWVEMNSGRVMDDAGGDCYCPDCESQGEEPSFKYHAYVACD